MTKKLKWGLPRCAPTATIARLAQQLGIAIALHRRALGRPVGTVNAALAPDGLHAVATPLAIVDVLTGFGRHGLECLVIAGRTRDDRL